MIIRDIETIFVNSEYCEMSDDRTEFFLVIEEDVNPYTHIAVTAISINNQVLDDYEADVIYMHCSGVRSLIGSKFDTGSFDGDYHDVITAMNVKDHFKTFNETFDLIAGMRKYNKDSRMKFHFTNSKHEKMALSDHCDFTLHFVRVDDDVISKFKTFIQLIGHMVGSA